MKPFISAAAVLLCFVGHASAEGAQVSAAPPSSPLSWIDITATVAEKPRIPSASVVGLSAQPVSMKLVELVDERPYGEETSCRAWLARYEKIPVFRDSSNALFVTVTLAIHADTGNLVCAFTDPGPIWTQKAKPTGDIAARKGWKIYPAKYEQLRSSVTEVFAAIAKYHVSNPAQHPQIVLRPRFNNNELGVMVIQTPPCNVWIIELLGSVAITNRGGPLTTRIVAYRDEDLTQLFGTFAP